MQASRRKAPAVEGFHPAPLKRAETFAGQDMKYNIRYAVPQAAAAALSDDDSPRRSSAHHRRPSETPPTSRGKEAPKSSSKEKEREREKERKRTGRSNSRDPYPHIVEPPSPPPLPKQQKPSLQTHSSAPPMVPGFTAKKEPVRSKTDYPRSKDVSIPTLGRAATFQSGDRAPERGAQRSSRLKKTVDYVSDSDSDSPVYASKRHSHSPSPRRREAPEPVRYIIDNGRSVPIASRGRHRSEMRNIDDEVPYSPRERERSESPNGTPRHPRASDRPSVSRAQGSGTRSHSQTHYTTPPAAPEPVIREARPKMPPRESNHGHSRAGIPAPAGPYFDQVKYAIPYRPEDVIYNDAYRRGSDPSSSPHAARDYGAYASAPLRGERVYA
jgi:hypothetical protein